MHFMQIDLKDKGIDGARAEAIFDQVKLYVNRNSMPTDFKGQNPSGIRIGTLSLTTRGANAKHFEALSEILDKAIKLVPLLKKLSGEHFNKVKDFKIWLENHSAEIKEV